MASNVMDETENCEADQRRTPFEILIRKGCKPGYPPHQRGWPASSNLSQFYTVLQCYKEKKILRQFCSNLLETKHEEQRLRIICFVQRPTINDLTANRQRSRLGYQQESRKCQSIAWSRGQYSILRLHQESLFCSFFLNRLNCTAAHTDAPIVFQ